MVPRSRHTELGHFLQTRRRRVQPEDVGLATGRRRRTTGLRREEVAVLADVSPAWYRSLELGQKIRPSVEVLDSLADALGLDHTGRRYLHALGAPAGSMLPDTATHPATVGNIRRLMATGRDTSYPAYATDATGALLAWNAQMAEWYDDFSVREGRERNIVWWMFTAPRAQARIEGWEQEARELVARARFSVGSNRTDPAARTILDELHDVSAEFATWWDQHDVLDHGVWRRTFRHPRLGRRTLDIFVVHPTPSPSVSVVFHLPTTDVGPGPPRR